MSLIGWIVLVFIFVVFARLFRRVGSTSNAQHYLGIRGEVVWIDKGKATTAFRHPEYRIIGKGDAIQVRNNGGFRLWEYKSRKRPVFHADIQQARAAALATRGGGWDIREIAIKTPLQTKRISLPNCDKQLYKFIQQDVEIVRKAKAGETLRAAPSRAKCRACAFMADCVKPER